MRLNTFTLFAIAVWLVMLYVISQVVFWVVSRPPEHLLLGGGAILIFGVWLFIYRRLGGKK
jgi:hypothetical protein